MTLAEFNIYTYERSLEMKNDEISLAWKIVNFVGLWFGNKLKNMDEYIIKHKDEKRREQTTREKNIEQCKEQARRLGDIP